MKICNYLYLSLAFLLVFSCSFIICGCTPRTRMSIGALNTPEHHVFTGMRLLEIGKLSDAEREFSLAKELDYRYAPSYRGLGLVFAYKRDFMSAFDNLSKAGKFAKSKEEEILVYIGLMRIYTLQKKKDWLKDVAYTFEKANEILKEIHKEWPEPYFYMGLAYKEAYLFGEAAEQFKKVLEINTNFVEKADYELRLIQKIESARPKTTIGKKIALLEKVTRVDVAALFIQEMGLDKLYKKFKPKEFDALFKSPGQTFSVCQMPVPGDVVDHPLRTDVQTVVTLKIRGLNVFPDGTFVPNKYVTRACYAMMIADIISTISNDPSLDTKYAGSSSSFADVRNDLPYFNAIMVCTTRGIIKAEKGPRQTMFNPMGSVSGADALLIISRAKEELGIL